MKISVLDDYHDTVRTLTCFSKLAGHDVTIWNDHVQDVDQPAERLKDAEALVLIRERTHIRAPLIERLPKLKLISQRSAYPHRRDACTRRGITVSSSQHVDTPSYATAELTWGSFCRRAPDPQQMSSLMQSRWQIGRGACAARRSNLWLRPDGGAVAGVGKAFGMNVLVWARGLRERARADGCDSAPTRRNSSSSATITPTRGSSTRRAAS
jgi:D-3-phosphoglycerate dehydrogenase